MTGEIISGIGDNSRKPRKTQPFAPEIIAVQAGLASQPCIPSLMSPEFINITVKKGALFVAAVIKVLIIITARQEKFWNPWPHHK